MRNNFNNRIYNNLFIIYNNSIMNKKEFIIQIFKYDIKIKYMKIIRDTNNKYFIILIKYDK